MNTSRLLITLKRHDYLMRETIQKTLSSLDIEGNGIACPECNSELVDVPYHANADLYQFPFYVDITCLLPGCHYIGKRLAFVTERL